MRTIPLILAAALLSVACQPAAAEDDPATVSVNGEAELRVLPDRATLSVAAEIDAETAEAAADEAHRVARAFVEAAEKLGAREEQIRSTAVHVSPRMRWEEKRRQQVRDGFRGRRDIVVEIDDLEKLGDFIAAAQRAGVTHISPPQLEASDAAEHQREALKRAAADARRNAEAVTEGLSLRLGRLLSISDSQQNIRPPQPVAMRAMAADGAESASEEMGMRSGEIVYSARVQARFVVE